MALLPVLALLASCAVNDARAERSALPTEPARLRVEAGRALVLGSDGLRTQLPGEGDRALLGPLQVEVPPGSRALLRWPGHASAEITGPAGLVWRPRTKTESEHWALLGRGSFELEVRSGVVLAELAPGWHARLAAGAWRVEGLADDSTRLLHRAGAPLELAWRGPGRRLLPPTFVQPGEWLRLTATPAQPSPRDQSRSAPAWSQDTPVRWPFGTPPASALVEQAAAQLEPAPQQPHAPSESPGLASTATDSAVTPEAVLEPTPVEPLEATDAAPAHALEPMDEPSFAAVDVAPEPPTDRWRGVPLSTRASALGLTYERSLYLHLEHRADGGHFAVLHPAAPAGIWLFTAALDLYLAPGAAALVDAQGELAARAGAVRSYQRLR